MSWKFPVVVGRSGVRRLNFGGAFIRYELWRPLRFTAAALNETQIPAVTKAEF
jgi:hypothetical protein